MLSPTTVVETLLLITKALGELMEPTAGKSAKNGGFTLIELLVTIAVAIILATIAVPNFQSMIVRNRLVADHNEVLTGLSYARSEAVKRREKVSAVITPDADGNGWKLQVWHDDGTGDVTCPADAECLQVRDKTNSSVNISTSSDGKVTFNSLGRLSGASSIKFEISHGGSYTRCVAVGLSGMVSSQEGSCSGS
ncbi:GspH/FimT family pseudopilin [Halomonas rhizosphaerae]|uniref:Type II secretion system protein H n=1 Tax=Halomonas rhizosphaerae TaxID=3043296 RepID=A0ABT6UWV8_9GAMM|nr:GspH/FimT family pseudopilin [Halomonas rhizosphaerae]MDI5890439.1 GspH/FimT family pseudopilin [Halomonas rhizosphaerae]